MRLYQKIIVGILSVLAICIVGITIYGIRALDDVNSAINNISQTVNRKTKKRDVAVSIEDREPFSILLLGIDTGALGRTETGRSDSMMLVTVNPKKKQSTIVSLDRDILTDMLDGSTFDKLNHAYAYGGVELSMDAVEKLLDVPVDHYVTINMQGMRDLIDAVGGIEVDNKIDFTLEKVHVPKGKITLNGKTGLAYARMRYDDPEGDIGRQRRQREVVEKIVKKVLSMDGVSNYQKILKAVEKNSKTDLTWDDMLDIGKNYYPAFDNIQQEQLEGIGEQVNGIYYQVLGINELLTIQNTLKEQLELPKNSELAIDPQFEYSMNGFIGNQFYDDRLGNEQGQASSENQIIDSEEAYIEEPYTEEIYQ
ncbi:LCP family protein [Enterococcus saccharolyticus]|uniref:LCP family glycopolymer transferase n=1 Tax=Enterococcus saccharolyticus TaxID=41997 RepID=UPI001E49B991|nr:LCP family protein [Enterococcus saccharolyticus]MCD5003351.1 LCP family protein [Enterococcus saccharolyticus]